MRRSMQRYQNAYFNYFILLEMKFNLIGVATNIYFTFIYLDKESSTERNLLGRAIRICREEEEKARPNIAVFEDSYCPKQVHTFVCTDNSINFQAAYAVTSKLEVGTCMGSFFSLI